MKKLLAASALAVALLGVSTVPASAHAVFSSITIDEAVGSSTEVKVSGTLSCNPDTEVFRARVTITQGASFGKGSSGHSQCAFEKYSAKVNLLSGPGFTADPATVCVRVSTAPDNSSAPHNTTPQKCMTITLSV